MSVENSHFLARKFQDFQRQSTRTYICARCPDERLFQNEQRLWDHAAATHSETTGDSSLNASRDGRAQVNPLERPAAGESGALGQPTDSQEEPGLPRDRPAKAILDKPFHIPKHPEFNRKYSLAAGSGFPGERTTPNRLFNLKSEVPMYSLTTQDRFNLTGSRSDFDTWMDPEPKILLQPETRPISHEQLVVEVKGIYAGLVMVEAKCIDVDEKQSTAAQDRKCLGDLGRYRMAIEDDDIRDREVWSGVAKFWYGKAADNKPQVGRLYHHLAILARPFTLQQLSLYLRALTCIVPFESASGSIMTLFNPILEGKESIKHIEMDIPWSELASFLTTLAKHQVITNRITNEAFPEPDSSVGRHLPEDFVMRAHLWSNNYFPSTWSKDAKLDDEERSLELPFFTAPRLERLLWLGHHATSVLYTMIRDRIDDARIYCYGSFHNYAEALRWLCFPGVSSSSSLIGLIRKLSLIYMTCPVLALDSDHSGALSVAIRPTGIWPFGPNIPSFSDWPFIPFGGATLISAYLLARNIGYARVWRGMMSVWSFVWWSVRCDQRTTPTVLWTTFLVGITSIYCYGHVQFHRHQIDGSYVLGVLLAALLVDYTAASVFRDANGSVSEDGLIAFFLPCLSLCLTLFTHFVPLVQKWRKWRLAIRLERRVRDRAEMPV